MNPLWQSWCSLCYKNLELGKYEEINGKLICDNCNPKKRKDTVYVYVRIPEDSESKNGKKKK